MTEGAKGNLILFDATVLMIAFLGTCLILKPLLASEIKLLGYRRFLICLIVGDLYTIIVNFINMFYQIAADYAPATFAYQICLCKVLRSLQLAGYCSNLFILIAMSADQFIGTIYPMQYSYLLSKKIAKMLPFLLWIVSFAFAFVDYPVNGIIYLNELAKLQDNTAEPNETLSSKFFEAYFRRLLNKQLDAKLSANKSSYSTFETVAKPIFTLDEPEDRLKKLRIPSAHQMLDDLAPDIGTRNFCDFYTYSKLILEGFIMALTIFCLGFLIIIYSYIFRRISSKLSSANRRLRKLIVTTFLLIGSFILCWPPFVFFEFCLLITYYSVGYKDKASKWLLVDYLPYQHALHSLHLCYPLVDLIIYTCRVKSLRKNMAEQYRLTSFIGHIIKLWQTNSSNGLLASSPPQRPMEINSCVSVQTDDIKVGQYESLGNDRNKRQRFSAFSFKTKRPTLKSFKVGRLRQSSGTSRLLPPGTFQLNNRNEENSLGFELARHSNVATCATSQNLSKVRITNPFKTPTNVPNSHETIVLNQ